MAQRRITTRGKHRAQRSTRERRRTAGRAVVAERRKVAVAATVSAVGAASVAVAGAALIGIAPTLSASPQLMATLHYLRGTNIGGVPTEQQYQDFITVVVDGTGTPTPDGPYEQVPYNAGFRPFSHGGFKDLTFNKSVAQGVQLLGEQQPANGDIIFGYSQGAVVASQYKATHTGDTYLLVENPSRPNGGVMERFKGLTIPFLGVTFSGATPNNGVDGAPGDPTTDIARQYDGWADFPAYLWNPLALANAFAGILLLHSDVQTELTAADLAEAKAAGGDYYQYDAASNTTYYLVKTYPIPLLMPLQPILPAPVIAALDAPMRSFIELAYDRDDYSKPTRARLFPPLRKAVETDSVGVTNTAPTAESPVSGEHPAVQQQVAAPVEATPRASVEVKTPRSDVAVQADGADEDSHRGGTSHPRRHLWAPERRLDDSTAEDDDPRASTSKTVRKPAHNADVDGATRAGASSATDGTGTGNGGDSVGGGDA